MEREWHSDSAFSFLISHLCALYSGYEGVRAGIVGYFIGLGLFTSLGQKSNPHI